MEAELTEVIKAALKEDLSKDDVSRLLGLQRQPKPKTGSIFYKLSIAVGAIAILWCILFGFKSPLTMRNEISESFNKSACFIDHSEASLEFVRPVTNCAAMCEGLTEVPRFDSITRDEFLKDFAYTGRPLVVTGATRNWTAMDVFNFNYFKKLYNKYEDAYDVQEQGSCQFFAYKTDFGSLEDVFLMSKRRAALKGKPWYIGWSNCHTKVMQDFRKHYEKPDFLPLESETSQQDWFFMGGSGPGAPVHIDTVDRPSWQAQISGRKSWKLIPPAECEHVCRSLNVTMSPGDIVVVDTNQWFHSTYVHPGDICITIGAEYD